MEDVLAHLRSPAASQAEAEASEDEREYVPFTLASVVEADRRARKDREETHGQPCELCEIADCSVEGVSPAVADVYRLEEQHRRTMEDKQLWRVIAEKYNNTVLPRANMTRAGRQRGFRPLTVRMVRRHFTQRHDRNRERQLWSEIDYLQSTLDELKRGSLWQKDVSKERPTPVPNNKKCVLF